MEILIVIAIIVVVLIGVFVGLIFKSSVSGSKKLSASKPKALSGAQADKLASARRAISAGQQLALRVKDDQIAKAAKDVLKQAEDIVATMKSQPEEIRRASQFFNYYLPTINSVLQKYVELEQAGLDCTQQAETVKAYLADTAAAFETAHRNLFNDEKMNLEVATEAMQMALKRDGLL